MFDKQEENRMNKLFVLMGKSATGKDTIFKEVLKNKEVELKTIM